MVSSADVPDSFIMSWKSAKRPAACNPRNRPDNLDSSGDSQVTFRTSSAKLRSACDGCRQARVKCSGGRPCQRCQRHTTRCHYSLSMRSGRLKATHSRVRLPRSLTPREVPSRAETEGSDTTRDSRRTTVGEFSPSLTPADVPDLSLRSLFPAELDRLSLSTMMPPLSSTNHAEGTGAHTDCLPKSLSPSPLQADMPSLSQHADFDFGTATSETFPMSSQMTTLSLPFDSPFSESDAGFLNMTCSCLKTQLHCIAELCGPVDVDRTGLDSILETTRQTCLQISQQLSCKDCSKASTGLILITIVLQRLLCMLCRVATNATFYLKNIKLGIGIFQLSEEDDQYHKKLLVISAVQKVEAVMEEVRTSVRLFQPQCYQQQVHTELATQTCRDNLAWIADAIRGMKERSQVVISLVEAHDWGRS